MRLAVPALGLGFAGAGGESRFRENSHMASDESFHKVFMPRDDAYP